MAKEKITGAEALMRSLEHEGVTTLFGYPGGAIMPVYDALYGYKDKLNHVLVRHEQGATHAAQGYARVSGKVGVALVTSGPGATNTITGIADAMMDSTPIVVIAGQVGASLLGSDAFQECDLVGVTQPISKWAYQIRRPEDVAWAVSRAFILPRAAGRDRSCWTLPRMRRSAWWTTNRRVRISFAVMCLYPRPTRGRYVRRLH